MSLPLCSNCGATLTGPYCAACGQHAHESARTVSALFHDAVHVMTHVDGRFWQTMYMLLLRPGRLTQEYFAERRARYLPPVRVYLVLSLLFFALGPLGLQRTRESTATPSKNEASALADVPAAHGEKQESGNSAGAPPRGNGLNIEFADCDKIKTSFKWLEEPLRRSCRRNAGSGGAPVWAAFVANIPKMMFVFLPLLAVVMLLMYWRPRRYYVEHLVFFLHTHAAMFLIRRDSAGASHDRRIPQIWRVRLRGLVRLPCHARLLRPAPLAHSHEVHCRRRHVHHFPQHHAGGNPAC